MGYLRVRAGSGIPKTVSVSYELTGLTTTGATSTNAYAPFTFVLSGVGTRIPPTSIKIWMGGAFLTQGVDYTYNKDTGSVTIRQVLDDILVEAVGKTATIIWSPAEACKYFLVVQIDATSDSGVRDGSYIFWYDSIPSTIMSGYASADWLYPPYSSSGTYSMSVIGRYHSAKCYTTREDAFKALFDKTTEYISGGLTPIKGSFSRWGGGWYVRANVPYGVYKSKFSNSVRGAEYMHWYSQPGYIGVQTEIDYVDLYPSIFTDYDVIKVQS